MIAVLFQGSFKKQLKFNQFLSKQKESVISITLEPVSPEEWQQGTSSASFSVVTSVGLPSTFGIPIFPKSLQTKLDHKEPCQKNPKDRHTIIRVLYEAAAQHTMYPTNAEYVQAVKMLIVKYPFLRDLEGNGYHTWHMSLKRKFKFERAPLIDNDEVRRSKERFGFKGSKQLVESTRTSQRNVSKVPNIIGEDPFSIEAHVKVLHSQYQKVQPDTAIVKDRMQQTFAWRRKEIADGMTLADTLEKYPFLRSSTSLCEEVQRIHPGMENVQQRFSEGLACIIPKVLNLTQGKSPLYQLYQAARNEALSEDVADIDRRAALIFLPYIFREKNDLFIMLGEGDSPSPYPTIHLTGQDWKMAFTRRAATIVKADNIVVCHTQTVDEGIISAFCTYFVFNLAYPRHLKNTLMFLQRYIAGIVEEGDRPLPLTVTRKINLLY
ncbi:uncharacterized protein LOC110368027 isoform X2 [Fundulus heteroclitus]|uniref:uncharacterized protein LOC110368027 isoform X2 n=1 Tax=Fundulus heteroclitus TaxID=8078 RepID=UPI00165B06BC|nr:uncharacterized protein LOC110368027 isoform X2 [Fundulus heteroclitus]